MSPRLHRAERYIRDVLSGKIPACKWVKAACQRHVDDLEHGAERGLYFDREAAQYAEDFFSQVLRHPKNAIKTRAGEPLVLEDWEVATITWPLFGWKRRDGSRRFRRAFIGIPKKNGKSTLSSGLADLLLFADHELAAEVYSVAGSRDQAGITFDISKAMIELSPELSQRAEIFRRSITYKDSRSVYKVLSADAPTAHGINAHGIIFDELHVQPNRLLFDALWGAGAARRQPLFVMLTTAGYDQESVCYEMWNYSQEILDGIVDDDSFWAVIYTIDDGDDWTRESTWKKANPNLGITIDRQAMREEAKQAKSIPGYQNTFKRLKLNLWTEAETRLITAEQWRANRVPRPQLEGLECYGGLDLASTSDIAALVLDFQVEPEAHYWLPFFWVPKENILERSREHRVNYDAWARDGWLRLTEGNVIDLKIIKRDIEELAKVYDIKQIAFDRWGAREISADLEAAGLEMVEFGQGFVSMAAPTKEFLRLVASEKLNHDGNPVLRWMINNLVARQDEAGNLKPDKKRSRNKIDGVVAGIMGLDLGLRHPETSKSVYERRGVRTLGGTTTQAPAGPQ